MGKKLHHLLRARTRDITLRDIDAMSEDEVRAMFSKARWGEEDKQVCPECGTLDDHYWKATRKQWVCKSKGCAKTFSMLSGTKFADAKLPLRELLKMVFVYVTNAKGVSAIHMCRLVGVSYKTSFIVMHKLREAVMVSMEASKLAGEVHVDGSHVGGKVRKANKKSDRQTRQQRDRIPDAASQFHPNRRIVMVARTVEKRTGAVRTVVAQVKQENRENVVPFVRNNVEVGSEIHTDENPAYMQLGAKYDHQTVNHGVEFQSDDGVDNNQAESFFTRHKRMITGQLHQMRPKYMCDYAHETAWREDTRRKTDLELLQRMLGVAMCSGTSVFWRGYHQGHRRQDEILFPRTVSEAIDITIEHAKEHDVLMKLKREDPVAWEEATIRKYLDDVLAGKNPRRPKVMMGRSVEADG